MKLNDNDYSIEEMYCDKCNGNTLGMIMHKKEMLSKYPDKWTDGVPNCTNCSDAIEYGDDTTDDHHPDSVEKHMIDQRKGFNTYNRVNKQIAELREYADHYTSSRENSGYFPDIYKMSKQQLIETVDHLMGTAKMFKDKLDKNKIKLIK